MLIKFRQAETFRFQNLFSPEITPCIYSDILYNFYHDKIAEANGEYVFV